MTVSGCLRVWEGHSGSWRIAARDNLGPGRLEVETDPGEAYPFSYTAGLRSQLDVAFRWSEQRDTTLLLWIGLEGPGRRGEEACRPSVG